MTVQPKFQHHSDYTTYEAIALFVIGFFLIIMIIVGNFLVIWAVIKDKSLKNLQNWFIGRYILIDASESIKDSPYFSITIFLIKATKSKLKAGRHASFLK